MFASLAFKNQKLAASNSGGGARSSKRTVDARPMAIWRISGAFEHADLKQALAL
jgi:hypothetical protein